VASTPLTQLLDVLMASALDRELLNFSEGSTTSYASKAREEVGRVRIGEASFRVIRT